MNHREGHAPVNRLEGLLRRRGPSLRVATRTASVGDLARTSGPAGAPESPPPGPGAKYRYRRARHELILAIRGVTGRHEAAVARVAAEFALVVEGPLLVFRYRFGTTIPWSSAAPYNWHFTPASERVAPSAPPLTPDTYTRPWATLWITLVDADDGRPRVGRAVALRPEFTHALVGVLRDQAMRPFHGEAADRALDRLRFATGPGALRPRVTTRCPGAWTPDAGGPARARGTS